MMIKEKKMKKFRFSSVLMVLILMMSVTVMFTACKKDDPSPKDGSTEAIGDAGDPDADIPDDPTAKNYDNGIVFEEEGDGYEVSLTEKGSDAFIGSWEATSGYSHYLFGNLELDILKDGKWTGNVTDEDLSGTWEEKDGGIYLSGDVFKGQLNFSDSGTLLLQYLPYEDSTEPEVIVLSKK